MFCCFIHKHVVLRCTHFINKMLVWLDVTIRLIHINEARGRLDATMIWTCIYI